MEFVLLNRKTVSVSLMVASLSFGLASCGNPNSASSPSSASTSISGAPSQASDQLPPSAPSDVKVAVIDRGPNAKLEFSIVPGGISDGQALWDAFKITSDKFGINESITTTTGTINVTSQLLGQKVTFTVSSMKLGSIGAGTNVTISVPKDALTIDLSAYKSLSSRSWAKLLKTPDSYTGKQFVIYAKITQFDAATGADTFRAQGSYRNQSYWFTDGDNIIVTGLESELANFVEDDEVKIWVTCAGSYSYDTQSGGNTTVPLFAVTKIKLN